MASETTFDHWKVVFSQGKVRKRALTQNPPHGWILISWNPILYSFLCTKTKRFTMDNFFSLDACSSSTWCSIQNSEYFAKYNAQVVGNIAFLLLGVCHWQWPAPHPPTPRQYFQKQYNRYSIAVHLLQILFIYYSPLHFICLDSIQLILKPLSTLTSGISIGSIRCKWKSQIYGTQSHNLFL